MRLLVLVLVALVPALLLAGQHAPAWTLLLALPGGALTTVAVHGLGYDLGRREGERVGRVASRPGPAPTTPMPPVSPTPWPGPGPWYRLGGSEPGPERADRVIVDAELFERKGGE